MVLQEKIINACNKFDENPTPDNAENLLQEIENIHWGLVRRIEKAKKVFLDSGRTGCETLPI